MPEIRRQAKDCREHQCGRLNSNIQFHIIIGPFILAFHGPIHRSMFRCPDYGKYFACFSRAHHHNVPPSIIYKFIYFPFSWMAETMPETPPWQVGMIWLPAFFPHVLGVYVTVRLLKRYPQQSWLFAAIGLSMEGISCLVVPFMGSVLQLVVPLSTICFGIALIDTSLLPMLGYLVDTRHVSGCHFCHFLVLKSPKIY